MTMKIKIPCFNTPFNDKWLYKFFTVTIYPLQGDGCGIFYPAKNLFLCFQMEK